MCSGFKSLSHFFYIKPIQELDKVKVAITCFFFSQNLMWFIDRKKKLSYPNQSGIGKMLSETKLSDKINDWVCNFEGWPSLFS